MTSFCIGFSSRKVGICSCTDGYAVAVGYAVAQLAMQLHSWLYSCTVGYAVTQLAIHLHSWLCSCTVGYAVIQLAMQLHSWLCSCTFSIIWVRSCMVISQFSTVHMVKLVQLHIFLCNSIS